MRMTLATAETHADDIVRLRREICSLIHLDPNGRSVHPLPYAAYVFGWEEGVEQPIAMGELFRYDQAFDRFEDAVYSQATDLSRLGSLRELVHIRSMYTAPNRRSGRLFGYLCVAVAVAARGLGARYATAGTSVDNAAILKIHRAAGMQPLGGYTVDGAPQQLSLLEIEWVLKRAERLRYKHIVQFSDDVLIEISGRRA